ncbi:GIY-YIG nuclease family protein [bacterium]|nr:GIY-YIG nuclease family protein [bacterium]
MAKRLRTKQLKTCWVYVLRCRDGSFYTGWTNDLKKRVQTHQQGKGGKYTRSRLPVRLAAAWGKRSARDARRGEALFKQLSRQEKILRMRNSGKVRSTRVRPRVDADGA